jgi:hypothetical protein
MPSKPTFSDFAPVGPQPPRPLGESGAAMWRRLVCELEVQEPPLLEQLCLACEAMDTVATISAELEKAETPQPALRRDLLANRAFIVKTLAKLPFVGTRRTGPGRPPMAVFPNA